MLYSDAAQTAAVIKYSDVPDEFIGTLLPPLTLTVDEFLEFMLHGICGESGSLDHEDPLAARASWTSEHPTQPLSHDLSVHSPSPLHTPFFHSSTPPNLKKLAPLLSMDFAFPLRL